MSTLEPSEDSRRAAELAPLLSLPLINRRRPGSPQPLAPIDTNLRDCQKIPCYPEHPPQHHVPTQTYPSYGFIAGRRPGSLSSDPSNHVISSGSSSRLLSTPHSSPGSEIIGHSYGRYRHSDDMMGAEVLLDLSAGESPRSASAITQDRFTRDLPQPRHTPGSWRSHELSNVKPTHNESDSSHSRRSMDVMLPPFTAHQYTSLSSLPALLQTPLIKRPSQDALTSIESSFRSSDSYSNLRSFVRRGSPPPEFEFPRMRHNESAMAQSSASTNVGAVRKSNGRAKRGRATAGRRRPAPYDRPAPERRRRHRRIETPSESDDEGSSEASGNTGKGKPNSASHQKDMAKWFGTGCTTTGCDNADHNPPRKFVSQLFGRNKAATLRMPPFIIPLICRKCYQQKCYRQRRDCVFYMTQAEEVRNALHNSNAHAGDRDWTICLATGIRKLIDKRSARIKAANSRGARRGREAVALTNATAGPEQVKRGDVVHTYPASTFIFLADIEHHFGKHKTTDDCLQVLALMEEYCKNHYEDLQNGSLPDIEFLPMGRCEFLLVSSFSVIDANLCAGGDKIGVYVHDRADWVPPVIEHDD